MGSSSRCPFRTMKVVLWFALSLLMLSRGSSVRDRPYAGLILVQITSIPPNVLQSIMQNNKDMTILHISNYTATAIASRATLYRLKEEHIAVKVLHYNVQEFLDKEYAQLENRRLKREMLSVKNAIGKYLSLEEIYLFQNMVVTTCTHATVQKRTIGFTTNGNPIEVIQISKENSISNRRIIFIEAGIHAREWLSPAVANFIIYQLACTGKYSELLEMFDWSILPVLNSDGYEYSHMGHRFWRNNRQANNQSACVGTDINRNFETGFGREDGSSEDKCDENYHGTAPFSSPEARSLRDHLQQMKRPIITYLALHTFGQFILTPWSYKDGLPPDYLNLERLARVAMLAMGLPFQIGPGFSLIYPAAGTSHDWVREEVGVALTYVWEIMPDNDHGYEGFSPPEARVEEYSRTVWEGVKSYARALEDDR